MLTILVPLFLTIAVAAALPADAAAAACVPSIKSYTANYDNLTYVYGGPNPLPTPYQGLDYSGFQLGQYDGFIVPSSPPNWAIAFGGTGSFYVPSPPKQSFALTGFSYACDAGIPQPPCAISVTGTRIDGSTIKRTIIYAAQPAGQASYTMSKTTFDATWIGLKSVGFTIARADTGGDIFGALTLDDVKYTIGSIC